jgi:adenylate cyclase
MLEYGSNSRDVDIKRADKLATQAVAISPRSALARLTKGFVLRAQSRWEEAILEYETALALNANLVSALHSLAVCKLATGLIDEAIPLEEEAIRISPRDPSIVFWYFVIGAVHLLQSRIDEAIVWLEKARSASPSVPLVRGTLASAYALRDEPERAATELAEARKLHGGNLFSSIAHVRARSEWGVPKIRALWETTFFAGLRKLGMPEE